VGVQRDKDGAVLAYAGALLLQDDFDLALLKLASHQQTGRPPIIVTATDLGDGLVIRCPHCNAMHKFQQDWLGNNQLTCPNDACNAPLRVNPFIAGHGN